jgi:hypothetical protein
LFQIYTNWNLLFPRVEQADDVLMLWKCFDILHFSELFQSVNSTVEAEASTLYSPFGAGAFVRAAADLAEVAGPQPFVNFILFEINFTFKNTEV